MTKNLPFEKLWSWIFLVAIVIIGSSILRDLLVASPLTNSRWDIFKHEYFGSEDIHAHIIAIHDRETGDEILCIYPQRNEDVKGFSCWKSGRNWK